MPLKYLDDGNYAEGVIKDIPSWLLPKGAVSDSSNMIFDRPGVARQRGGISALSALGAQTAFATTLGFARSSDDAPLLELMAANGKTGHLYRINNATGAATDLGIPLGAAADTTYGRGVQHFGFVAFPGAGLGSGSTNRTLLCAGAVSATTFTGTATATVAAGSKLITLSGADVTTNIKVGHVFFGQNGTNYYVGRVTAIVSATTFNVWPTPTVAFTISAGSCQSRPFTTGINAACAASFQNRLLLGNVVDNNTAQPYDRRFIYSILPTETWTNTGLQLVQGAGFAYPFPGSGYPDLNFIDMPGTDPFVGMEPISDNELLILAARRPVVFRGNLVTQLATTSQQVTFDISEMDKNAGCATDHAIQRTPRGIMWAGVDGVFVYTGSDVVNVLEGRMATYWRTLARSSTFAIHGSAYLRGHYLVAGTSAGTAFQLLINLASREYTFAPQTGIDIFGAVLNPATPSQVFALRWWDQAGAAPSFTNGQTNRIESALDAYITGSTKTDADGSVVSFSITTRVLASDTETQKIMQRSTVRFQAAMAAANIAVTAQSKIDSSDIVAASVRALGSLSNTEARTITGSTNATPIVVTTSAAHGLQTDDFADINGVTGGTNANGRYRVNVLSTTTFSLVGSTPNGAGTGGSVKKVTETDFLINDLDQGQGVSFIVASSGTVNNFELHGFRVAYFEGAQVLSA